MENIYQTFQNSFLEKLAFKQRPPEVSGRWIGQVVAAWVAQGVSSAQALGAIHAKALGHIQGKCEGQCRCRPSTTEAKPWAPSPKGWSVSVTPSHHALGGDQISGFTWGLEVQPQQYASGATPCIVPYPQKATVCLEDICTNPYSSISPILLSLLTFSC